MGTVELTAERLREVLHYDPLTGLFTWRINLGNRALPGMTAGTKRSGRISICIDQHLYKAHRLAWLYVNGRWPVGEIDHINRQQSDNRFKNLRDVTHKQNMENQRLRVTNTTGMSGVFYNKRDRVWYAYIRHNYKRITLGIFKTKDLACAARIDGEKRYFTHSQVCTPEDGNL